jgi:hypothetical protein
VALDGGSCRACRAPIDEEDRRHTEVTPAVLKRLGYAVTPHAEGTAVWQRTARRKEGEES